MKKLIMVVVVMMMLLVVTIPVEASDKHFHPSYYKTAEEGAVALLEWSTGVCDADTVVIDPQTYGDAIVFFKGNEVLGYLHSQEEGYYEILEISYQLIYEMALDQ